MKTKEELNALKEEAKSKLAELSEEELAQVAGGAAPIKFSGGDPIPAEVLKMYFDNTESK